MRLTIDVTAEDIEQGVPYSACRCPVSLAICRALPPPPPVREHLIPADNFPPEVAAWIRQFDDDRTRVHPFTFTITIPDED